MLTYQTKWPTDDRSPVLVLDQQPCPHYSETNLAFYVHLFSLFFQIWGNIGGGGGYACCNLKRRHLSIYSQDVRLNSEAHFQLSRNRWILESVLNSSFSQHRSCLPFFENLAHEFSFMSPIITA